MILALVEHWDLTIFLMYKNVHKTPIIPCLNSIRINRCFVWVVHTYNIILSFQQLEAFVVLWYNYKKQEVMV